MRIAVIGCGSIGSRHARNLTAMGHRVCLSDVDVPKMTALAGTLHAHGGTGDPKRLDGLMICTPASTHAAVARELLDVGYFGPLFVEKPLACSVEECAIFRSWPHQRVQLGYNWRYNRELEAFRKTLADDYRNLHYVCTTQMRAWPGRGYTAPLLECSHEIDLALCWNPALRLDDAGPLSTGAWLELRSLDANALIELAWDAPSDRWMTARRPNGTLALCHPSAASVDQSYYDELRAWVWAIEHAQAPGARVGSSVEDGIAVLRIVEQAQRRLAA